MFGAHHGVPLLAPKAPGRQRAPGCPYGAALIRLSVPAAPEFVEEDWFLPLALLGLEFAGVEGARRGVHRAALLFRLLLHLGHALEQSRFRRGDPRPQPRLQSVSRGVRSVVAVRFGYVFQVSL